MAVIYATLIVKVATREGGVDRNIEWDAEEGHDYQSPPARVAWIET